MAVMLPYILTTTPSPLATSLAEDPRVGKIIFQIGVALPDSVIFYDPGEPGEGDLPPGGGDGTTRIHAKAFQIDIPIGNGREDLTDADRDTILGLDPYLTNLPGWQHTVEIVAGGKTARFIMRHPKGNYHVFTGATATAVTISIDNIPINRAPGEANIVIKEETSSSPSSGYTWKETSRRARKTSSDYYFRNLYPVTPWVERGSAPVLTWEGNERNTTFKVHWTDGTRDHEATVNGTTWTPDTGQAPVRDTTYLVEAIHVPEGTTTPISQFMATTIQVKNPDINANTLTVAGDTSLNGDTDTKNITVDANKTLKTSKIESSGWGYGIHVNTPLQLSGFLNGYNNTPVVFYNGITAAGGHTSSLIEGALTVGGATNLNGNTNTKSLTVTSGNALTASGNLTVAGAASLNGDTNLKATNVAAGSALTVNGNLTVDPGSAGYAWIKSGRLDINSAANFNAYGPVSLFKKSNRQLLWDQNILTNFGTKTYRADGDGLLTARVWSAREDSNVNAPELDSYFTVFATSAEVAQAATVAQSIRQGSPIPYSSFCLPVAKGNTVTVTLANSKPAGAGGGNNGKLWLFWTPLGGGPNLVQVATSTQAEEQEVIPVSDEGGDEHEDSTET
ncbi:hypothetical protein [Streptomyces lavendulae]|uniref:hypothetical protein n=1 Tax=Streptomyces lavendulae TaxID=1914 RepID=UPI00381520EA